MRSHQRWGDGFIRRGAAMFTPGDYLQRAAELEILAADAPDCALHAGYQKLAQAFRDLANAASVAQMQPNAEAVRHAVRMVGSLPGAQ